MLPVMAQVYSQAYGYNFYFMPLKKASIDFSEMNGAFSQFMDVDTLLSNSSTVETSGTGGTYAISLATAKTVTNAALTSNVATLTFAAAHGISTGDSITVAALPSPFTALNGTYTVTAVTTSSPFTLSYAKTASNITSAAVSFGTVTGPSSALALDGSDSPIRLLGLTNAAPSESEGEETIITYDDEAKSFDTSIATSKSFSWSLEGVTDHDDAAYKLLRICAKESVREGLMVKYARVGPTGHTEKTFGYGRFTGFDETPPAGGIVKWSSTIKAYGPYELRFS
jgi:hypothetical protein